MIDGQIKAAHPDLAIVDLSLTDGTGLDLIRSLRESLPARACASEVTGKQRGGSPTWSSPEGRLPLPPIDDPEAGAT